jgi:multimeric flavodoxin WrbA
MIEIYEKWVAAHAIIIMTPVYWYQDWLDWMGLIDAGAMLPEPSQTLSRK